MPVFTQEVQADQGNPQVLANAWPTEMTDGVNILGTPTHPVKIDPTGTTVQPVSGSVTTTPVVSSTSTVTRVATSTTSATALAANVNRKQAIINTEAGSTFVLFGTGTASVTNYSVLLAANSTFEVPPVWQGAIQVIRSSGTGNIQVTEMV